MADLSNGVFFQVGAVAAGSVATVVGGSVRHLDKLRKAAKATAGQAGAIAGYRALKSSQRASSTSCLPRRAWTSRYTR